MEQEGEPARWFAFVEKGYFKYVTHGISDGREHITWFSFTGEIVGDYPNMLHGGSSQFTIKAMTPCKVLRIDSESLFQFFNMNCEMMEYQRRIDHHLLILFQSRYVDFYRATASERYRLQLRRCPGIINDLPLAAIASFLNITPNHLSSIRKEITFANEKDI
ncbi:MAG: Crp/Fnr family transcriptional regulator [Prevotellaceae bacterium]|nr:Crp/Fnr family transcriptional regulator [Prevotellaceae bacterium]